MLTLLGNSSRKFCDGQSRRDFLRVGALGFGGLSLADLLRVESHAGDFGRVSSALGLAPPHAFARLFVIGKYAR